MKNFVVASSLSMLLASSAFAAQEHQEMQGMMSHMMQHMSEEHVEE